MAEELQGLEAVDARQSESGLDGSQATEPETQATADEQPEKADNQTGTAEDTFFDPRDIQDRPELVAAYKQMQRAYTKKMQAISDQRQKIEAYDQFYQNPLEQIQRVAQQYGYHLTPAQAQQIQDQQQQESWEPSTWKDVDQRVEQRAREIVEKIIAERIEPMATEVKSIRKASIETQLAEIDPTWQQYEDEMKRNLKDHPTLSKNPAMLYRISVPQSVLESRATQAALKKIEQRTQSANVSGKSTTARSPHEGIPDRNLTFAEAVAVAKKVVSNKGLFPPRGQGD